MSKTHNTFNGSIPQNYNHYLGPIIFEDYALDLAQEASSLEKKKILEIAAGTGILTRKLSQVLPPETEIIVTDLSQGMLQFGYKAAEQKANLRFCGADAMHLPFPDNSFDMIIVQFAIMFFPDKVATLKEWARVLKPDGQVLLNIWDSIEENHLIKTVTGALEKFYPEDIPEFFNIPYGWCDPDEIKRVFQEANYKSFEMTVSQRESPCISAQQVALGYLTGTPFAHEISKQNDFTLETVSAHVENIIANTHGNPPKNAMMQAFIVSARPFI